MLSNLYINTNVGWGVRENVGDRLTYLEDFLKKKIQIFYVAFIVNTAITVCHVWGYFWKFEMNKSSVKQGLPLPPTFSLSLLISRLFNQYPNHDKLGQKTNLSLPNEFSQNLFIYFFIFYLNHNHILNNKIACENET